jgi:hypothetical protein
MSKTMQKSLLGKRPIHQTKLNNELTNSRPLFMFNKLKQLKPSTLAVLVQSVAFLTVLIIFKFSNLIVNVGVSSFSIIDFVIMQSLLAAAFSYCLNMAVWWRWIHLCFPLAMLAMTHWQLPNEFYLAGFIISLSLFWTTFRSQVPFYPSRPIVWKQVAKIMPKDRHLKLIDIGSGLGDMSMYIAKVRPDSQIEGIEIAPLPWLISRLRVKINRSKAIFKLGDYHALNFADYDIIFAYLSPAAMLALWQKSSREMKTGSLLISLEFEIPGVNPTMRIAGNDHSPAIYVWQI